MKKAFIYLVLCGLAAASGCGNDAEGPVTRPFLDSGSYSPKAGETVRFVDTLRSVSVVDVPIGLGQASLLKLGEVRGIRFEAILISFGFDSLPEYAGRTVESASIYLPLITVQDTLFHLGVRFHELLGPFSEDDVLTEVPAYAAEPITGPAGETVRDINIERNTFPIATGPVQAWFDGTEAAWPYGIVIVWAVEPDTLGLIEMNAQNRGVNPPVLRVALAGDEEVIFPARADYTVTRCTQDGTAVVGGVARRVYFEYDLSGIPERAIPHYSALVLSIDGARGLGATVGELLLGLTTDFYYYLYAPATEDPNDPAFLAGTGIARSSFVPTLDARLRIPLGRYTIDLLDGQRANTGLVLQSDLETVRVQKASFHGGDADQSLRPLIEVIYTLPAEFGGAR